MKLWLYRIAICLILGAATTVGAAWWFEIKRSLQMAAGTRAFTSVNLTSREFDLHAEVWCYVGVDELLAWQLDEHAGGTTPQGFNFPLRIASHTPMGVSSFVMVATYGWPCRAMYHTRGDPGAGTEVQYGLIEVGPKPKYGPPYPGLLRLPILAIYPGFLINTLFYAAIWFGLVVSGRTTRRHLRRRRGRCPICAYDLRGHTMSGADPGHLSKWERGEHAGCPECGWGRHPSPQADPPAWVS